MSDEKYFEAVMEQLEQEHGAKIFTIRMNTENETENEIETIVVFEDEAILQGIIKVEPIDGKMGIRLQMNYI